MTIYIRPIANILRSTPGIVILLFIWNAVTQLFINIDSPLHHYWSGHIDSAWFFTAGRAWMNGLTPYVDFADSKGPLLWLIYGIGYLISPHDFSGLYVISCVYYTAVLWMCYRTALIFLQGQKIWSFLAAAAMVIPYFCWIDVEVRAESWCQLQLSYCLYRLTLAITDHSTIYNRKAMAWMGIAIASVMLIKWNLAILYGIIPCAIIVMRLRTDSLSAIKSIAIFILAFICFSIPFAAYLYYHGALSACINEYMLNTGNMMASINVSGNGTFVYYLKSFLRFITDGRCWAIVFCISSLMLLIRQIGGGLSVYIPTAIGFLYILVLTYHDMGYYIKGMASFATYLIIWLTVGIMHSTSTKHPSSVTPAALAIIMAWCVLMPFRAHSNWKSAGHMPVDHGRAVAEQAALAFGKPKILYYYGYDCGCAIAAESLPVSKYWALQNNATMEMALHQDSILASGAADIVIFQTNHWTFRPSETAEDIAARITAAGYKHIADFTISNTWKSRAYIKVSKSH